MAVMGQAEKPSVVASRMQLVFSTLEVSLMLLHSVEISRDIVVIFVWHVYRSIWNMLKLTQRKKHSPRDILLLDCKTESLEEKGDQRRYGLWCVV